MVHLLDLAHLMFYSYLFNSSVSSFDDRSTDNLMLSATISNVVGNRWTLSTCPLDRKHYFIGSIPVKIVVLDKNLASAISSFVGLFIDDVQ